MIALALLAASAYVSPLAHRAVVSRAAVRMGAEEDALVAQGEACLATGCSVGEINTLIANLNQRRYDLQKELTYTLITLGKLEAMNARASKQEDREGIDAVVKDAVRIFSRSSSGNDYPALPEPTGYSMDPIGKDHLSIFED